MNANTNVTSIAGIRIIVTIVIVVMMLLNLGINFSLIKTEETMRDELQAAFTKYQVSTEVMAEIKDDLDDVELYTFVSTGVNFVLLIGLCVWFNFLLGSTANSLGHVADILGNSSEIVSTTSSELATSSQHLAEGSSEQAASVEETSASLEEMASMAKSNSQSAASAKGIADHARKAAEAGAASMSELEEAMKAIQASSDNISKIIKTIDEIAFQTNILALNAAVEAARAGEAGMGFAVVADEVRNLAQRSAVAARETADQIEESILSGQNGVNISIKVKTSLEEIVSKVRQVDQIIAEIATASQEQATGVEELMKAVSEIDRVTQSNAASSEETASAAEELSSQSNSLKHTIYELVKVVHGKSSNKSSSFSQKMDVRTEPLQPTMKRTASPTRTGAQQHTSHSQPSPSKSKKALQLTDKSSAASKKDEFDDFFK